MARKSAAPRGKRLRSAPHSTALEAAVEGTKRVLDEEAHLSAELERLLAERKAPDDKLIKVSRAKLAKRFGQKTAPTKKR